MKVLAPLAMLLVLGCAPAVDDAAAAAAGGGHRVDGTGGGGHAPDDDPPDPPLDLYGPDVLVRIPPAFDGESVYVATGITSYRGAADIRRIPIEGGASEILHHSEIAVGSLVASPGRVFWTEADAPDGSAYTLWSAPSGGVAAPVVAVPIPGSYVVAAAADGDRFVYSDGVTLRQVDATRGEVETLPGGEEVADLLDGYLFVRQGRTIVASTTHDLLDLDLDGARVLRAGSSAHCVAVDDTDVFWTPGAPHDDGFDDPHPTVQAPLDGSSALLTVHSGWGAYLADLRSLIFLDYLEEKEGLPRLLQVPKGGGPARMVSAGTGIDYAAFVTTERSRYIVTREDSMIRRYTKRILPTDD